MLPTCIATCSIQTLAQEVVSPAEKEQDDGGRLGCGDACIPPGGCSLRRAPQRVQFVHLPCLA